MPFTYLDEQPNNVSYLDDNGDPIKNDGFLSRVGADISKRQQQVMEIGQRDLNPLNEVGQLGAVGQGVMADIVGQGMVSAGRGLSAITPDIIEEPIVGGAKALANYVLPTEKIAQGAEKYKQFEQNYPNLSTYLSGAGNLVGNIATVAPVGEAYKAVKAISPETKMAIKSSVAKTKDAISPTTLIAKAIPNVEEGVKDTAKLARSYDIPVSIEQISGSRAIKEGQKVSQSLPFSGQAGFREKQLSKWQENILKTVGVNSDKFTRKNIDEAFTRVGKEFDDLGSGKNFNLDDNFARRLDEIRNDASIVSSKDAIDNFNSMAEKVLKEADRTGSITGEKLNKMRSTVNAMARKTNNMDTQELLHDLENAIIDQMIGDDDIAKAAFSETKKKYKNLIALEPLVKKAKGGNIPPTLLNERVSRVYGRDYSRGKAGEIGDLAQIGYELLSENLGSDTMQKAALIGTGLGGIASVPVTAAALAGNRAIQGVNRSQKIVDKLLNIQKGVNKP